MGRVHASALHPLDAPGDIENRYWTTECGVGDRTGFRLRCLDWIFGGVVQEPRSRLWQGKAMHFVGFDEHVGIDFGFGVEETARRLLFVVADELKKIRAAARVSVAFHFHSDDVAVAPVPEEVDSAMLKARVVLNIVKRAAGRDREQMLACELDCPIGNPANTPHRILFGHVVAQRSMPARVCALGAQESEAP